MERPRFLGKLSPMFRIMRVTPANLEFAREAIVEVHGRSIESDDVLTSFLRDDNTLMFVALERDRVVGSVYGYRLRNPHTAKPQYYLYEVDVREDMRRRGIGLTLVDAFTEATRSVGACEAWVGTEAVNAPALSLYERAGYTIEENHVVMFVTEF